MTALLVHPLDRPLVGSVPVAPDASIAERALVLAALCEGTSEIRGLPRREGDLLLVEALRAMGVGVEDVGSGVRMTGKGLFGLRAPSAPIACGRSTTVLQLLAGVLSAQPFRATLASDAAGADRWMPSLVEALRARGAVVDGAPHSPPAGELPPPLVVGPLPEGAHLAELEYESAVADADVKGAVLLSGLFAHGATWFKEPTLSRDHTERMLHALGVPLRTLGPMVELDPAGWDGMMKAFSLDVPGDVSAAAFLVVAAQMMPGSRVTVRGVGTNPTRTGFVDIARLMGAGVEVTPLGDQGGEPVGELTAWQGAPHGVLIGGELVPRAIDEIPVLAVLAARARGTTTIRDADELRAAPLDRLSAMTAVLRAFGVGCEELPDGMVVEGRGGAPLEPAVVDSRGDARVAMSAALLALAGRAPSRIEDCDVIAATYPKFVGTLRALGARIDVEP